MKSPFVRNTLFAGLAVLVAGCVTRQMAPDAPGVAPALVVEQFLRAANTNDLETMARLFGTSDGAVLGRDPRRSVEERMFAIASVLRHDDYAFEGEQIVPGRTNEALQLIVRLTTTSRSVQVPFTLVTTRNGNWLIEQIGIERLTNPR